jgi:Uma2 family endonuclease
LDTGFNSNFGLAMLSSQMGGDRPATLSTNLSDELAECGWRIEEISHPDGRTEFQYIPLTAAEFLHPKEGYRLPNTTFHETIAGNARDLLTRRYADRSDVGIYRDLLIEWDRDDLADLCPDTFVAFGVREPEANRGKFIVRTEGVKPIFVLEVVSPRYRKADREDKVLGVQEYVIVDRRTMRKQQIDEVIGYRLISDQLSGTSQYQPITPDDDGRILSQTLGLWISLCDGELWLEDAVTGDRLKTAMELEQRTVELEQRTVELEQQASEMADLLERYRQQFGALPPS